MSSLHVVSHVAENLADPVLELQVDQHFGHLVANSVAFLIEQVGGFGHGLGGKPDVVDTDQWASSRIKRAHPSGFEESQCTVNFCCPKGISILTGIC